MKLARLLPVMSVVGIDDEESVMKSLIGAAFVARRARACRCRPRSVRPPRRRRRRRKVPAHPTPPISARTAMSGAITIVITAIVARTTSPLLRSAGLLSAVSLSIRRRRSPSASGSVRSGEYVGRISGASSAAARNEYASGRLHVHLCGRCIHGAFTCLSLTSRWERPQRNATGTSRKAAEGAPSPVREIHPWRYPIPDAALSAVWA